MIKYPLNIILVLNMCILAIEVAFVVNFVAVIEKKSNRYGKFILKSHHAITSKKLARYIFVT